MTEPNRIMGRLLPWAGFLLGPGAWLANTQLGQILPHAECGGGFRATILLSFLGTGLSVLGAWISWRHSGLRARPAGCLAFVGSVGVLLGLVVAFALLLQGMAALVLSGCER
jgi:hypothetical protein